MKLQSLTGFIILSFTALNPIAKAAEDCSERKLINQTNKIIHSLQSIPKKMPEPLKGFVLSALDMKKRDMYKNTELSVEEKNKKLLALKSFLEHDKEKLNKPFYKLWDLEQNLQQIKWKTDRECHISSQKLKNSVTIASKKIKDALIVNKQVTDAFDYLDSEVKIEMASLESLTEFLSSYDKIIDENKSYAFKSSTPSFIFSKLVEIRLLKELVLNELPTENPDAIQLLQNYIEGGELDRYQSEYEARVSKPYSKNSDIDTWLSNIVAIAQFFPINPDLKNKIDLFSVLFHTEGPEGRRSAWGTLPDESMIIKLLKLELKLKVPPIKGLGQFYKIYSEVNLDNSGYGGAESIAMELLEDYSKLQSATENKTPIWILESFMAAHQYLADKKLVYIGDQHVCKEIAPKEDLFKKRENSYYCPMIVNSEDYGPNGTRYEFMGRTEVGCGSMRYSENPEVWASCTYGLIRELQSQLQLKYNSEKNIWE